MVRLPRRAAQSKAEVVRTAAAVVACAGTVFLVASKVVGC